MALQMGNWGYNPTYKGYNMVISPFITGDGAQLICVFFFNKNAPIWGCYLPKSYALRVLLPGFMGCLVVVMNFHGKIKILGTQSHGGGLVQMIFIFNWVTLRFHPLIFQDFLAKKIQLEELSDKEIHIGLTAHPFDLTFFESSKNRI